MAKIEEINFERQRSENAPDLSEIWQRLFEQEPLAFYEKVRAFEQSLKHEFPDYIDYEMYHVLNGTSVSPSFPLKKQDFPGEFSVREFLRKAEKEFGK